MWAVEQGNTLTTASTSWYFSFPVIPVKANDGDPLLTKNILKPVIFPGGDWYAGRGKLASLAISFIAFTTWLPFHHSPLACAKLRRISFKGPRCPRTAWWWVFMKKMPYNLAVWGWIMLGFLPNYRAHQAVFHLLMKEFNLLNGDLKKNQIIHVPSCQHVHMPFWDILRMLAFKQLDATYHTFQAKKHGASKTISIGQRSWV